MSKQKAPLQSGEVSCALKKPHTHAGQHYQAGQTIIVTLAEAAWLAANGITEQQEQHHG
ncbi:DUF7210 family protein [Atopomonas sediminilitoris]|uniref:DUF7210 family protein n=1 Tax=Atopomonas sediminilitoris TaxID=2919919 RepID=UPI001F4D88AE|nr:hypothetical protein [Atopomonas sediminilitoris]MCJ8168634.1 hypothetical protein [Atopomonas sediminilitoris]